MRLKGYDYSQPGFYYVTICTQDRIERFGDVENDQMILNDAGELVHAEWNRIPERYEHVVLDKYQIMPNHLHGILEIIFQENGRNKPFENGSVGMGLVPILNEQDESLETSHSHVDEPNAPVLNDHEKSIEIDHNHINQTNVPVRKDVDGTVKNGPIAGDKTHAKTSENDNAASERRGTRPLPTPLYDIIGTFKSLTQNEYADHVRNNGWPPFRKRLWQLRFHDHIIRNETELNRIRKYIEDNPKNWVDDENNPRNIKNNNETDS